MAEIRKVKRIDEEMVCADSIVHCLKNQCGCHEVTVEKEKDDPPDFWFTIDGERYAGEVTSIVIEQGYHESCKKLKDKILNSCREAGSISGKYVLHIWRQPGIPKRTSYQWKDLVKRATSFINATQEMESTEKECLVKDPSGRLHILKISGEGATVGISAVPKSKWVGEIENELRELIGARVKEKRQKLERKGIPALCPRIILLLYDAYGFAEVEDAQKVMLGVSGYDWFHSVFWAASFTDRLNELSPDNPGRVGRFLYSANDKWWKNRQCD